MNAIQLITDLKLQSHPEGGFFRETYRSSGVIPQNVLPEGFKGDRHYCTSIYLLLQQGDYSAFHRIKSDEGWHFYQGGPLLIHLISPEGSYLVVTMGNQPSLGQVFQFVVPARYWFASEPARGSEYSLVGCTVSPGFDFQDFEMAARESLTSLFPQHQSLIERLSR
ncbi:MAG: cupin domain-containing protein [Bacteroidota bacterium]|nr:cupin domain-containing protein [Bacteroidota bacterium]